MPDRTRIVCLCEGRKGGSIDEVFINRLLRSLNPSWLRPWPGSNTVRIKSLGGRSEVMAETAAELKRCLDQGGDTTLMVWADIDDDRDGETLKGEFRRSVLAEGIGEREFERIVFVFAKNRLENWIEFLVDGSTDELIEGRRVTNRVAKDAAEKLARWCRTRADEELPPSLRWSCRNWRSLVARMTG